MNILVVCQYYKPEQFKINEICEQLALGGNQVTILTGLPNYPSGKIPREYRWWKKRKEVINRVKVIRCFEIGRKSGTLGLALNYASYMLSASIKALSMKKDFDAIFVYQLSPVTMVLPAVILKKRSSKPLFLYCCDIWPESMKNILSNEKSFAYRIVRKFSKYLYSKCDSISVTSKPFIEYFIQEHAISVQKISYIPQHAQEAYLHMDFSSHNDIIDFVFMGNIGIAQDIECIINAAQIIKDTTKFKIHFVGEGSCIKISKDLVKNKGLDNIVIFHGRHPLEKMPHFYKLADACLVTLKAGSLIGLTMPSKLQEYMAAGKPVIGAINGAAQDIINETECGRCINASDSGALAKVMEDFIKNPDKYKDCGEKGRAYFEKHFTMNVFMEKLQTELKRLVKGIDNV